jgi:hypothetical protein
MCFYWYSRKNIQDYIHYVRNSFWRHGSKLIADENNFHLQIYVTDVRHIAPMTLRRVSDACCQNASPMPQIGDGVEKSGLRKNVSNDPLIGDSFGKTCLQ